MRDMDSWPWEYCPTCKFDVIPVGGVCMRKKPAPIHENAAIPYGGHRVNSSVRPKNGHIPELLRLDTQFRKWLKETGGLQST